MNKKTVLSVLLCSALLSTATSCNRSNAIYSNNSTDSQFLEENTSAYTQQIENINNKNDGIDLKHIGKSQDIFPANNGAFLSHEESKKASVSEESLPENIELIKSEKHFQIYKYKDAVNKHFYRILDSNGNTVISETTTRPLSVSIIEDNIIDISIGFGSGVCQHQYYDIDKNILSEPFFDVFATSGELIVYMDVPKENAMKDRTLVIQNIFDKEELFVEYKLDFSNYIIPIEKIEFLTNSDSLQITYYKGSEKELTTGILNYS